MSAQIPLRNRAGDVLAHAIVDEDLLEHLSAWRWSRTGSGYAYGSPGFMHRIVLGLQKGDRKEADHVNRDRLDNRRANLRVVTHLENSANSALADHHAARREEALRMYEAGVSREDILATLSMSHHTLRAILPPAAPRPHPNLIWSRERIAEWMRDFHRQHGRIPAGSDLQGTDGAPWFTTVYRRFPGGLLEAREFAGFGALDLRRAAA